ncbi:hypothetical protein ZEAMMB73_Zm00001d020689, partial [Zea mays]
SLPSLPPSSPRHTPTLGFPSNSSVRFQKNSQRRAGPVTARPSRGQPFPGLLVQHLAADAAHAGRGGAVPRGDARGRHRPLQALRRRAGRRRRARGARHRDRGLRHRGRCGRRRRLRGGGERGAAVLLQGGEPPPPRLCQVPLRGRQGRPAVGGGPSP